MPSLYLDLAGAVDADGTNVQLYGGNGTVAQRFTLQTSYGGSPVDFAAEVEDGLYFIRTSMSSSKVLDIAAGSVEAGANLQIYSSNGTDAQKFELTNSPGGTCTLTCLASGLVLGVDGSNVCQLEPDGGAAQAWYAKPTGTGYICFVSALTGQCLDVASGSVADMTSVGVYARNDTAAQFFSLEAAPLVQNGVYEVSSALNPAYVVDIAGASAANGANVQLWESNGTSAQRFAIVYDASSGCYTVTSVCSGKLWDVLDGSGGPSNVHQYEAEGTDMQRWRIERVGDGLYAFVSAVSPGLRLTVEGDSAASGANVAVAYADGSAAQMFGLTMVDNLADADGLVVDISYFETVVNWPLFASNVSLSILRVQDPAREKSGENRLDPAYDNYASNCEAYGVPYGVYAFARYSTELEARAEATSFYNLATAGGHNPKFFAIDIEVDGPVSTTTEVFISTLKRLGAEKVGIYVGESYYMRNATAIASADFVWIPRYGTNDGTIQWNRMPNYSCDIWQYTSLGIVPGISGYVDMNKLMLDGPNFRGYTWYIN